MAITGAVERGTLLEYATAGDVDLRPLSGRLWWASLVWAVSWAGWSASMAAAEFLLWREHKHRSETAVWAGLMAVNAAFSCALAGVLIVQRRGDPLFGRTVASAAALASSGVMLLLVAYARSIWSSASSGQVSARMTVLVAGQSLAMLFSWCLMPVSLLAATLVAAPDRPMRCRSRSPLLLALSLASCASLALAMQRLAQLGYIAFPGILAIQVAHWRDGWLLIAAQAVTFLLSTFMFGWSALRIRSGQSGLLIIRIAAALVVSAVLGGLVVEKARDGFLFNIEGIFGRTLAVLRDVLLPLPVLAPLLPALMWPSARHSEVTGMT